MEQTKCRACGADMFFATTDRGKQVPLNADPEKRFILVGGKAILVDSYSTHFVDCPNAAEFRKA